MLPRGSSSFDHEQTFEVDVADREEVRRVLLDQVEQVARRLRKQGLKARGASLKIRYGDFETISRSARRRGMRRLTPPERHEYQAPLCRLPACINADCW
jgi:hypothetical protein